MKIKFPRASLRARIIAWSFVPTTIILLAVALVTFYAYQRVTEDLVVGRNQQVTRLSAGQLAADLGNYTDSLTTLARTADISQGAPARQSAALEQAASRLAVFDGGMLVLNHLGQVVATDPGRSPLLGQDWSTRAFFRGIIHNTGPTFSDILPGSPEIIAVAVPILSEQGESRGSLVGMFRLDASTVSAFYAGLVKLRLSDSGSTFLVDSAGRVIYHPDPSRIGGDVHEQAVVQQVLKRQAGYLRTRDLDQRDILATFAPVPGTPWGLVNEEDWSSLLASGRSYEQFLIMLLALGVMVPTLVVAFGVKRITDPVAKLIVAAKEIAGGKFGRQIAVRTGDELEELVKQFNLMSKELEDSYAALKEREERLALVIEGTNDGIWDWNLETDEVYFSPRWKAMLGYEDAEIANRFESWLQLMHPDDRDQVAADLRAYLKGHTPIYQIEHRLRHKDGSYQWILARGIALRRADGKPYRMAGSHTDITERRRADEAIRQSEKRFSQVFHASPVPIVMTSLADGRYVEVNDAWLRLMGYTRAEVMGNTSLGLNVWAEPEQRAEMLQQLQASGSVRNEEYLTRTKSGELRDILLSAEVLELNNERYLLCFIYDITELKQTQESLERRVAERTHELAALNAIAAVASRSLDLREILADTLDKILQVMGMEFGAAYRIEVSPEDPIHRLTLSPMAFRGFSEELERYSSNLPYFGPAFENAIAVAAAGEPIVWGVEDAPNELGLKQALEQEGVRLVISVPLMAKGQLVGVINLGARNPRAVTPEELSLLAAVGQQIGVAVENARLYDQAEQSAALAERTRLARELHDSVTQSLYSVTLYAEAAAVLLDSGNDREAAKHLRELRDTAQEGLREMRLLIYELRPLALENCGLVAALQGRLDAVETRGGMRTELQVEGEEQLPLALQQELYHVAQEALNNVIKHAHAQRVRLHLVFSDISACLEIDDDGVGFDMAHQGRGGMGLAGMRERVERVGGKLEIVSAEGKGTQVRVQVPIRELRGT